MERRHSKLGVDQKRQQLTRGDGKRFLKSLIETCKSFILFPLKGEQKWISDPQIGWVLCWRFVEMNTL